MFYEVCMKDVVVVTGYLGYIGFNLVSVLLRLGYSVIGVDKRIESGQVSRFFNTTGFENNGEMMAFSCDLAHADEVNDFLKWCKKQKIKARCLVNLAGSTSIPLSNKDPVTTVGNNMLLQYHALNIAHKLNCERFIQANSITSLDCGNNWNPYSWSKSLQYDLIQDFIRLNSCFDVIDVIISNPIGNLAGIDYSCGALEKAIASVMMQGGTLNLSVQHNGQYDESFKRNFISIYELISVFLYAITCVKTKDVSNINAVIPNQYGCVEMYSVVQFAKYCNRYNKKDFQFNYIKPNNSDITSIVQPCTYNVEHGKYCEMMVDMPELLFDYPVYFTRKQRKVLDKIRALFKDSMDELYTPNLRFELLYNTIKLNRIK